MLIPVYYGACSAVQFYIVKVEEGGKAAGGHCYMYGGEAGVILPAFGAVLMCCDMNVFWKSMIWRSWYHSVPDDGGRYVCSIHLFWWLMRGYSEAMICSGRCIEKWLFWRTVWWRYCWGWPYDCVILVWYHYSVRERMTGGGEIFLFYSLLHSLWRSTIMIYSNSSVDIFNGSILYFLLCIQFWRRWREEKNGGHYSDDIPSVHSIERVLRYSTCWWWCSSLCLLSVIPLMELPYAVPDSVRLPSCSVICWCREWSAAALLLVCLRDDLFFCLTCLLEDTDSSFTMIAVTCSCCMIVLRVLYYLTLLEISISVRARCRALVPDARPYYSRYHAFLRTWRRCGGATFGIVILEHSDAVLERYYCCRIVTVRYHRLGITDGDAYTLSLLFCSVLYLYHFLYRYWWWRLFTCDWCVIDVDDDDVPTDSCVLVPTVPWKLWRCDDFCRERRFSCRHGEYTVVGSMLFLVWCVFWWENLVYASAATRCDTTECIDLPDGRDMTGGLLILYDIRFRGWRSASMMMGSITWRIFYLILLEEIRILLLFLFWYSAVLPWWRWYWW